MARACAAVAVFRDAAPDRQYKILDTSVIIDGRIADVCETSFLDGVLVVPQFVLKELQFVADSADSMKRNRGRRGLDILQKIQKMAGVQVMISDIDFPEQGSRSEANRTGKHAHGKIVTNDFNLNKVAQLRGVQVLNINELANALKPVVLPGEFMKVFILKEGKEYNQGVAYLDDGTMVVVDNARRMIGKTIDIVVTSVLQTTAGKMIFGRHIDPAVAAAQTSPARPRRQRDDSSRACGRPSAGRKVASRAGPSCLLGLLTLHLIRTVFYLIPLIAVYTIVLGTLSLASSLFTPRAFAHGCARIWSWLILATTGVEVGDLEHLTPATTSSSSRIIRASTTFRCCSAPAVSVAHHREGFARQLSVSRLAPGAHGTRARRASEPGSRGRSQARRADARRGFADRLSGRHPQRRRPRWPLQGRHLSAGDRGRIADRAAVGRTRDVMRKGRLATCPGNVTLQVLDPIDTGGALQGRRACARRPRAHDRRCGAAMHSRRARRSPVHSRPASWPSTTSGRRRWTSAIPRCDAEQNVRGGTATAMAPASAHVQATRPRSYEGAALVRSAAAARAQGRSAAARQRAGRHLQLVLGRDAAAVRTVRRKRIEGAIALRLGRPGEIYDGIRKDPVNVDGRLTLADSAGPFGNPSADSLRTSVTAATTRSLAVIFAPRALGEARVREALEKTSARVTRFAGGRETGRWVVQ